MRRPRFPLSTHSNEQASHRSRGGFIPSGRAIRTSSSSHGTSGLSAWLHDAMAEQRYVAFLRAINLGRNRKFPMADVRACLGSAGFEDVETHIQTGNVRLSVPAAAGLASREKVEAELERVFAATTGFEVPTMAFTPAELVAVHDKVHRLDVAAERRYVAFLKREPDAAARKEVEAWSAPGEGARVVGRTIFWWLDHATAAAKLSNVRLEKLIGPATTRDLKVVDKLVEKWC